MRMLMFALVAAVMASITTTCADPEANPSDGRAVDLTPAPIPEFADAEVTRIYRAMGQAQGSLEAWGRARYLTFDFVVRRDEGDFRRSHEWDRWGGRAQVTWASDEGETVAVVDSKDPTQGQVWVAGEAVPAGPHADSLLMQAYRAHINDAYWLVMPFKWADPGVHARFLGKETAEDGRIFDVVELSFDGVGVTPDNMYHAYVNTETGLMERWAHYSTPDAEPRFAEWGGYEEIGPLRLALDKGRIQFENVRVLEGELPDGAFALPN